MVQQDKELRTVKRRLESVTGRKVYYTLGGIKRTGASGKTGTARGAITPDGIYLRCDDDSASVTQLAGHELYHYYEEQFPGLHDRVRQRITERYSEEEFREIAGKYAEKLGRLNGLAENMDAESYEAMLDRIESEIFADAFGNINYFRLGADRYTDAAREIVRGGRIYVPESVKHEFGDDWSSFRKDAFAEGIFLTNNESDRGWDSWNAELSAELPGLFAEDETDPRDFLERVVHLAREGRDQELSLAEYAANVIGSEYVSEDKLLDNMERKLDWALRSYADKAGLEIWLRNKTEEKLAKQREQFGERLDRERAQRLAREQKEREKRKEAARRQSVNRELQEMQQRTLKMLQQLEKNRQRFYGDLVPYVDEILSDIDLFSTRAADEAHIDRESGMTWREMADIYKAAKENDPNFLPSKDLERIVARLDNRKIGDMDIDAVTDLYKAAVGLCTERKSRRIDMAEGLKGAEQDSQKRQKPHRNHKELGGVWHAMRDSNPRPSGP